MRSTDGEELNRLLDEQLAYYRALAPDYLDQGLDLPGGGEIAAALDAFQPTGSVLELACGPGVWTGQLLRYAADVTAVDASPEMLAIAAAPAGREQVRFIQANLFTWKPDRCYDVVFIGFWLSHVPAERFESFWSLVADCLKPEGRVFSPTTPTAPRMNWSKAPHPRPSVGRSLTEPPTGSSRCLTSQETWKDGSGNSAGTSRSPRQPGLSTGEREARVSTPHERARRVPVRRATQGDSRSLTEQPAFALDLCSRRSAGRVHLLCKQVFGGSSPLAPPVCS